MTGESIQLSLVAHTNVGKTTLARTLLRRDIGEVRDEPHVTDLPEAQTLIDTPEGDALLLWDTPGFGDSARLLNRLRHSGNPLGWLLTQVWDRFTDRPFYCSQQAIHTARDHSDVILYLVNAAEDPASAAYVQMEMQILAWLDKPVLLLLNQTGAPRTAEVEAAEVAMWRNHLAGFPCVRGALALDAFMRCWVQEDQLLGAVEDLLPDEKRPAFGRLRAAWRARNLQIFAASADVLTEQLAQLATDRESLPPTTLRQRAGRWLGSLVSGNEPNDPGSERAMQQLALRLDAKVVEATDRLIALHHLSGQAATEIHKRMAAQFRVKTAADVGTTGLLGGLASGALGGLTADLAAGGLSFGAGALVGGVLGALGAGGAARAYNSLRGTDTGEVAWSEDFLTARCESALLRYLAVAHFGRGRGDWQAGEYPAHWSEVCRDVVAPHQAALYEIWQALSAQTPDPTAQEQLRLLMQQLMTEALVRLYPASRPLFNLRGS